MFLVVFVVAVVVADAIDHVANNSANANFANGGVVNFVGITRKQEGCDVSVAGRRQEGHVLV